jgi:hypothetical protein
MLLAENRAPEAHMGMSAHAQVIKEYEREIFSDRKGCGKDTELQAYYRVRLGQVRVAASLQEGRHLRF